VQGSWLRSSGGNQDRWKGAASRLHEVREKGDSPKEPDSSGSKTSRSFPLEPDLALEAMENLRVRGMLADQESSGLEGFWKKSFVVEKRRARVRGRGGADSEWPRSKCVAGEWCCMGEREGVVSITVDALMKEHL